MIRTWLHAQPYGSPSSIFSDIENYMNDKVTHVLTNEAWDKDFDHVSMCV